jgi:hypothetical protein
MAVTFSESTMQVTPVLSVDLGYYSDANGSAQLLPDGNYFFLPSIVAVTLNEISAFSMEVGPTPATGRADRILNLQGPEHYRAWQVPNLYSPPAT